MSDSVKIIAKYLEEVPVFRRETISAETEQRPGLVKIMSASDYAGPSEIVLLSSYTPVECGIATYSYDLVKSLENKFGNSFSIKICALESGVTNHIYPDEVKYRLDTSNSDDYIRIADTINTNNRIKIVLIQHEFGLFRNGAGKKFISFLHLLTKPVIIGFHTVLPRPDALLKVKVQEMAAHCESIIVMTHISAGILNTDYGVPEERITVIPHGTHLVLHLDKDFLKRKYELNGKKVLSTFGLLSSGKSIETTLEALPDIIKKNKQVMFLIIGKTHPGVFKLEGEKYRNMLEAKVEELHLHEHVRFINKYLPLPDLLEYLQLTDIYLFTSKDPNQAVSGTFAYAMSCACPIISTPIPHAREVLRDDTGIIVDFQNVEQLTGSIMRLLDDEPLLTKFTANTLLRIVPTAWENSAIAHAKLLKKISDTQISLSYRIPEVNLAHVKKMTTDFGMIQFSKFNQPDIESGFTLDDNARALIALCMHYALTGDKDDIRYIYTYLGFIKYCQQPDGHFLNYVGTDKKFTDQNNDTNLADSNGRAIWALGYLVSQSKLLPAKMIAVAELIIQNALLPLQLMHSTRAMAFAVKGLYYYNCKAKSPVIKLFIGTLAGRLVQMYKHEREDYWQWFESYLTYANSILPEALLCAWQETGEQVYKDIAEESFNFLLAQTFTKEGIKIISNKSWLHKGKDAAAFGEQPIDVAYTILSLQRFYDVFGRKEYKYKMEMAFNWFLGNNHLQQIIYNPCTGGCYDGLEETYVNLNQGAESTLSYLMARLTVEKQFNSK